MKQNLLVILFHLLFWGQNMARNLSFSGTYSKTEILFDQLLIAVLCYINYFFFIPYILRKNSAKYYILWVLVFVSGFTLIYAAWTFSQSFLFGAEPVASTLTIWLSIFNISFLYGAVSTGSKLALDWTRNQKKNKELALQKTTAQVQLVKSNVNMPFLLQVLNYTEEVSKDKPQKAEQPIMLLSNVLRYGLYESQSVSIALTKEMEIIEEYLLLQQFIHPTISTPLIVSGDTKQLVIVPHVLFRLISVWRSIIDKNKQDDPLPIQIQCAKDHVFLQLSINSIAVEQLKPLEEAIEKFNHDHLIVRYTCKADKWYLTILTN